MSSREVLITGIPRGGTTLTCELLNDIPDTVALDEPLEPMKIGDPGPDAISGVVRGFLSQTRRSLLRDGQAMTKHVGGRVYGGKVSQATEKTAREKLAVRGMASFDKPLSEDFLLAVKHPALFTTYLEPLAASFPLFAVVRHPLAVLASWQTVPFSVRDGHMPVAERFDAELARRLAAIPERLDRQLALLDWLFSRYGRLPDSRILRYEGIIASGGAALTAITANARSLSAPLSSRDRSYDRAGMQSLADRLLASDGAYWRFYERTSVAELLDA